MNYYDDEREQVFSELEKADSIVIFGHKNPDGDCVGSVLGMKHALKTLFPTKKVYAVGTDPAYLPVTEESDDISDEVIENSLALMVDLSDLERVEDQRILKAPKIVCIDHHMKQYDVPFAIVRDEKAPSATFIIAKCLLLRYGKIPSAECAKYLYMGLVTDSGRFQYDAEPETLEVASKLVSYGIDYRSMYNALYRQSSIDLKYRSVIYQNFKFDGLVTYCCMDKKTYQALGLTQNDAGGKVNLLSMLDDHPMWAFFTEQDDGTIRVELRSNGKYNVQKVAAQFNGGGHLAASGCKLETFDRVQEVIDALNHTESI